MHGSIVCVPRLDDIWVGPTECLSQRDEREAIEDHGQGVALGNSLAGEKDGAPGSRLASEDKLGGVTVAVESKPGAVGPSVPGGPEQGFPAKFVEAIGSIHQESALGVIGVGLFGCSRGACRAPLLVRVWGRGSVPHRWTSLVPLSSFSDNMGYTLNASAETRTEVEVAAGLSGMVARHGQQALGHESSVDLANTKGADTGLFVKGNKAAGHEGPVGSPRRVLICEPVGKFSHLGAQCKRFRAVAEEPSLELLTVSAAWTSSARELGGDFLHNIRGQHNGDRLGDRVVQFKDTVWVSQSGRLAHGWVLGLKDLQHGAACLGAQVSGEQDTTARRVGEILAG